MSGDGVIDAILILVALAAMGGWLFLMAKYLYLVDKIAGKNEKLRFIILVVVGPVAIAGLAAVLIKGIDSL